MLSLREHVAMRAVERSFADRAASASSWDDLCLSFDAAVIPTFGRGRKLRDGDVDRIADAARAGVESIAPLVVIDLRRAATRGKPKGEAREILCVAPHAAREDGYNIVELCTVRVFVSRKRAVIETGSAAMRVTAHAMRRSVERGIVDEREGVEFRFARQMLDHAGMAVVARALLPDGTLTTDDAMPMPFDDGLVLGRFMRGGEASFDRVVYDGTGRFPLPRPASRLITEDPRAGGVSAVYRGATVIGCAEMSTQQGRLWEALRGFWSRHREVVAAAGEAVLWPGAEMRPPPPVDLDGAPFREAVAALRAIMTDPGLKARRGPQPRAAAGAAVAGAAA